VTLAVSAWESVPSGPVIWPDLWARCPYVTVRDRPTPGLMAANGPTNRGPDCADGHALSSPVLLDSCRPLGRRRCVKAREATAWLGLDAADAAETIEQRGAHASATLTSARSWVLDVALPESGRSAFDPAPNHTTSG